MNIEMENELVKHFKEKPLADESWINGGFFVLEPQIFDYLKDDNIIKLLEYDKRNKEKGNGFGVKFHDPEKDNMSALKLGGGGCDDLINEGVILHNIYGGFGETEPRIFTDHSPAIRTAAGGGHIPSTITNSKIRRLTPRECFRLMDFPDTFTWSVSDTQAYKQAGNSIVREVLAQIINKLKL